MGNNEIMAIANAREIEKLPYETLKALFPSVRYMVQGEKWHRKFIGHRTNEMGNEETYASGEWRADLNGKSFENSTMALLWAQMTYSKGHFKVYARTARFRPIRERIGLYEPTTERSMPNDCT